MIDIVSPVTKFILKINPGMVKKIDERYDPLKKLAYFAAYWYNQHQEKEDRSPLSEPLIKKLDSCVQEWNQTIRKEKEKRPTFLETIDKDNQGKYVLPENLEGMLSEPYIQTRIH